MKKLGVLLIGFNRPDLTRLVMQQIRAYKPNRLYLACDGPRPSDPSDAELVEQVRQEMLDVDWDCEVETLFREKNLGLREGVVSAIDWFFEHEKEGVILEDDCLPNESFFRFMEIVLEEYRDRKEVFGATGSSPCEFSFPNGHTFSFVRLALIWGWATWKDRWDLYDRDLESYKNGLTGRTRFSWPSSHHFHALDWHLKNLLRNPSFSWDFQLSWTVVFERAVWIVPSANMVSNLGFREDATHTKSRSPGSARPTQQLRSIHRPHEIRVDTSVEQKVLEKTHRVFRPLWLNYLRNGYRNVQRLVR